MYAITTCATSHGVFLRTVGAVLNQVAVVTLWSLSPCQDQHPFYPVVGINRHVSATRRELYGLQRVDGTWHRGSAKVSDKLCCVYTHHRLSAAM